MILVVEPQFNFIQGLLTASSAEFLTRVDSVSVLTGEATNHYKVEFSECKLSPSLTTLTEEAFVKNFHNFVFKDNTIYVRPYWRIISTQRPDKLQLNTPVELTITYTDPDNLNWLTKLIERHDYLKVKDRLDFLTSVKQTIPLDQTGIYKIVIQSAFPGVARIRVKDSQYICVPAIQDFKFVQ